MAKARWAAVAVMVAAVALAACERPSSHQARTGFAARPELLEFGASAVGRTKTMKLRLANQGRASYRVEGARSSLPHVSIPPFEPFTLSSGAEQEIEVRFTPDVEGAVQGQLEVLTDASGEAVATVPVTGRGVKALVEVPETALDFGNVNLGLVEMREVTVRNPSDVESPLVLSVQGTDADQFSAGSGLPSSLAPHETRKVPVAFSPVRLGTAEAALHVTVCDGCEPAVVTLTGTGVASMLEVTPLRVDFGRVAVGATAEERITVRNQGNEPLSYTGAALLEDPSGVFQVVSAPPLVNDVLPAGGVVELRVAFTPKASGKARTGRVEVAVRKPGTTSPGPKVSLVGEGGASCVEVSPERLDFGPVAFGMTATRDVTVHNRCRDEASVTGLQLTTRAGGYFTLAQPPANQTVAPGGFLKVGLTFSPRAGFTGVSGGQLAVTTHHDGANATEGVVLAGEGRAFKPCVYALPGALDFGQVPVGSEVALGLTLRNTGSEACYLSALQLASGSDGAFRAEPVVNGALEPGRKATLVVRFQPPEEGDFQGLAEGWVSHPTLGHPLVTLSGRGVRGCFSVQPTTVDFGISRLACGPRTREFMAYNDCPGPVTVAGMKLVQPGAEFAVSGALPATLPAGARVKLTAKYTPAEEGDDTATVRFMLADGAVYNAGLVGRGLSRTEQTDRFFQEEEAKVDVLFVVDNSGSMMEEQQSLGSNFAAFLSAATASHVDYRIGVTTTGLDPSPGGWSECPGGALGGENGRLFPADGSSPRIITPQTPNAANVFATNTHVGVCHWNEQGLDAAWRALSDPLLYNLDDPRTPQPADGNGGFLREDAKLAIIALSDEEDFSSQPVSFYETYFLALKGNDRGKVSFNAVVGPLDLNTCPTSSSSGSRYMELARKLGGVVDSICTPNWAASLEKLSESAFGPNRSFPLSERPLDPGAITVRVDGVPVTEGWSYEAPGNVVVFDRLRAPGPGALVEITYPLGCP
ncbi:choice-of-anchor D domain-containing protein [Corallococcus llansteffanensis]|uniref:Choice-of-anchor D domain-containing protein n=1 Tax=Corallococcus llansteffanensis TaxID=2316731 RepID=A0A3A8NX97_9BACT|nr:choice-of-anchor D domain-containing protein [Corallococcus llansteffanensis]RKH48996.1 choice-of-anchor D domain-containing protein [Corallococcus llansteffanensis]